MKHTLCSIHNSSSLSYLGIINEGVVRDGVVLKISIDKLGRKKQACLVAGKGAGRGAL